MIMMVEIDISGGVGVGVDDQMMVVVLTMISCRKNRL